jgi:hypothetical protein
VEAPIPSDFDEAFPWIRRLEGCRILPPGSGEGKKEQGEQQRHFEERPKLADRAHHEKTSFHETDCGASENTVSARRLAKQKLPRQLD